MFYILLDTNQSHIYSFQVSHTGYTPTRTRNLQELNIVNNFCIPFSDTKSQHQMFI